MKKIMFSDRYGLTDAVLQGRKTMTRRLVGNRMTEDDIKAYLKGYTELANKCAQYKIGEVVAVAQSYKSVHEEMMNGNYGDSMYDGFRCTMVAGIKGWDNKLFVKADLMPHQIRITDIKVERLQDISEEDCLKEGIQEYFPYIDRDPNDKVRTFRYFKDEKIRHCISPASKCFAYLIDDTKALGSETPLFLFIHSNL